MIGWIRKVWKAFRSDPFDRSVPLNDRVLRYLYKHGRGDASSISVFLIEDSRTIRSVLLELADSGHIIPCKKQIGCDPFLTSYEVRPPSMW